MILLLLFPGIMTTLIGLILFTLDHKVPKMLAEFLVLDTSYEDNNEEYEQISTSVSLHSDTPNTSICINVSSIFATFCVSTACYTVSVSIFSIFSSTTTHQQLI